jgi:hypothetical protein
MRRSRMRNQHDTCLVFDTTGHFLSFVGSALSLRLYWFFRKKPAFFAQKRGSKAPKSNKISSSLRTVFPWVHETDRGVDPTRIAHGYLEKASASAAKLPPT